MGRIEQDTKQISIFDRRINRRKFLSLFFASIATLHLSSSSPKLQQEYKNQEDIEQEIVHYENGVGDRPLTFKETQDYISYLAKFFVNEISSPLNPEYLQRNTFVITRDLNNVSELKKASNELKNGSNLRENPVIRQLQQDYPDENFTNDINGILSAATRYEYAKGFSLGKKTFIFLERLNDVKGQRKKLLGLGGGFDINSGDTEISTGDNPDLESMQDKEPEKPQNNYSKQSLPPVSDPQDILQFHGFFHQVGCSTLVPVVNLRSTLLHEFVHIDGDSDWHNVQDFAEIFQKVSERIKTSRNLKYKDASVSNFTLKITADDQEILEGRIREFTADLLSIRMSNRLGLRYVPGYNHAPNHLVNYGIILDYAGIADKELAKLHRESKLKDFLLKVARGAQNIQFQNELEMIEFAIEHFVFTKDIISSTIEPVNWYHLKQYYPGIDINNYDYVLPEKFISRETFPGSNQYTQHGCVK